MVHLVKRFFCIPFSSEKVTIGQPSVLNGPLKRGYTGCVFPSSILSPAHTHDSPIMTYISFSYRSYFRVLFLKNLFFFFDDSDSDDGVGKDDREWLVDGRQFHL